MIDRFHSDDDVHQLGIVVVNVLNQFGLCIGWSRNEDRTGICDCFGSSVKVVVTLCGVPAPDGLGLMMDVSGRMIRMQNEFFDVCRAEMECARFMVIDPDDSMIVMLAHTTSSFRVSYRHRADVSVLG